MIVAFKKLFGRVCEIIEWQFQLKSHLNVIFSLFGVLCCVFTIYHFYFSSFISCFVKSVQLNDQRFRGEGVKFKGKVRNRNIKFFP